MFLSVIIPAYNEEKRIVKTLVSVSAYLEQQPYEYEIIVVSDGSTDATVKTVQDLHIPHLAIIENKENHGKGYVVRQGLLMARGQYRLFMDADNSTKINEVEKLLVHAKEDSGIVIASRSMRGSEITTFQPWFRRILGNVYVILVGICTGLWGLHDTQCGFKLLTETVAQEVLPYCSINRWSFDPEILMLAKRMGYKITEVPVRWTNDINTKLTFLGMIEASFDLAMLRWRLWGIGDQVADSST